MLRNVFIMVLLSVFLIVFPAASMFAENKLPTPEQKTDMSAAKNEFQQADSLLAKGGIENIKDALLMYKKIADRDPSNYTANWKCAKASYLYADSVRKSGAKDWKDVCEKYGKSGFQYGEKAIKIAPERVEGNLYYGLCVWKYSDGVSIARALAEGLKGSTQDAFEKSYKIDKKFDNGWPMKALGRFWHQLPWPLHDYKTSLRYLEEYHKYFPNDPQGLVYLSETLLDLDKDKGKVKTYLEEAANNKKDLYYSNRAKALLKDNF